MVLDNKGASFLGFFFIVFIFFVSSRSQAESIITATSEPQLLRSFKIGSNKSPNSCSYTVQIRTSCSSPSYTRDQISLAFGDAYGYQVYAPRIDNPSSRAFERCSTDTYHINGPCMHTICYVYLYRTGSDGWKPESVKIYAPNSRGVSFVYNTFIPYGVWYGFNFCNGNSMISEV